MEQAVRVAKENSPVDTGTLQSEIRYVEKEANENSVSFQVISTTNNNPNPSNKGYSSFQELPSRASSNPYFIRSAIMLAMTGLKPNIKQELFKYLEGGNNG